jgi:hypothetical protein
MRRVSWFSVRFLGVGALALVLALAVVGCTSTVRTEDRVARRVTITAGPAIEDLRTEEPAWRADGSNWALALTWEARDPVFDHYEVWRNGYALDEQVTGPSWTDTTVEPGTHYRYAVVGVTDDGVRTLPLRTSIRTDSPPVAQARLEGSFVMVMHVERAKGTDDPVDGGRVVFRFEPTCGRGACATRWTVRDRDTDVVLRFHGTRYSGRARTPLLIRNCFGDEVDERVLARFRVVDAALWHGRWRATKIEGAIAERSVRSGCMVASIRWSVRGGIR